MPVRSREIHALSTRIQLPVLRKLLSVMEGQHSALRWGRGWEFMDLAPYQPGDDVREIDWAATARTGTPTIKRHEATANVQVILVVDTGREMGRARRSRGARWLEEIRLVWLLGIRAGSALCPLVRAMGTLRRSCAAFRRILRCFLRARTCLGCCVGR